MKYLVVLIVLTGLASCGPREPDYVDRFGYEYKIQTYCAKSHTESKFGYHYGYNALRGKFNWHVGNYSERICDSTATDTIEINIDRKYYSRD